MRAARRDTNDPEAPNHLIRLTTDDRSLERRTTKVPYQFRWCCNKLRANRKKRPGFGEKCSDNYERRSNLEREKAERWQLQREFFAAA